MKKILKAGSGVGPPHGKQMVMHYTGTLTNGQKFDSSVDRGTPFKFTLGVGQVIQGWDVGVASMTKGEKAVLTIDSSMGYGARGAGGVIPPNATLVFEVELLGWEEGGGELGMLPMFVGIGLVVLVIGKVFGMF